MQNQPPWSDGAPQQPNQVVIGGVQTQTISGQPTHQQVIYVQAPAFKPNPNYRHISYMILGIGIILSIATSFFGSMTGEYWMSNFASSMCCGSIGIACIVDAMYYNDKSNWQQQTGADTTGTTIGMIGDIVFAILCLGVALLFLIGF